jgi:hypothetical protein
MIGLGGFPLPPAKNLIVCATDLFACIPIGALRLARFSQALRGIHQRHAEGPMLGDRDPLVAEIAHHQRPAEAAWGLLSWNGLTGRPCLVE